MNYRKQINVILTVFVTLFVFTTAFSADGDLDLSFNGTGKVITHVGNANDYSKASAIQSDGKLVVVGSSESRETHFALARYNIDGSLDNTFDEDGKVLTDVGDRGEAFSVAIQDDGKIIVAGYSQFGFTIIRYNQNGSLDTSFDSDGIAVVASGIAYSIAIQNDGKIVVSGNLYQSNVTELIKIVRLNPDGSLDSSFDGDGLVTTLPNGTNYGRAYSVVIQADGKILVYSPANASSIIRYNSDGSLDNLFGNNGQINFGEYRYFGNGSVAVQADGKIVALGYKQSGVVAFRFNSDGSPDISFGDFGLKLVQSGFLADSYSVKILSDGRIIFALAAINGITIVRLDSDGSFDKSFGLDGKINTYYSGGLKGVSISIQADNKIVTTHYFRETFGSIWDFEVTRYQADGSFDNSFDTDGTVLTGEFAGYSELNKMAIQSDGKIVAVGFAIVNSRESYLFDFAVVRYNTNGSLDTSFGTNGKVSTVVGNYRFSIAKSVAIQPDGKIIVAGVGYNFINGYFTSGFAIVRYNPDGSLDNTFDGDGKIITEIPNRIYGGANSVLIQADGKIVAAGSTGGNTSNQTIIRYNSDGSLDNTFGNNGVVIEPEWKVTDIVSLAIDPDGKLVTLGGINNGFGYYYNNSSLAIARYNTDGTIDNTFGIQGKVIRAFESSGQVKSLKIQADGKIVVGGTSKVGTSNNEPIDSDKRVFTIFRFNSDGSLDNTFDGDGKANAIFENDVNLSSLAIQTNGKIVAAGWSTGLDYFDVFAVARFNTDGSLDTTFDDDGKLTTVFTQKSAIANSVVIQPNGGIIVGGTVSNTFGLVRYQGTAVAQNAEISGRVTTAGGRGIANVSVQISGGNLVESKYTMTNSFGYYRFKDLAVGQTYVVGVSAKRYSFANPTRIINLKGNLSGEDFISDSK